MLNSSLISSVVPCELEAAVSFDVLLLPLVHPRVILRGMTQSISKGCCRYSHRFFVVV